MTNSTFKLDPLVASEFLENPETFATVLHIIILTSYGADVIYGSDGHEPIDPLELIAKLRDDYRSELHENNENKLNAMLMAFASDDFYHNLDVFISICSAIFDGDIDDVIENNFESISVPELLWGIFEVELNTNSNTEFDPNIKAFINKRMSDDAEDIGVDSGGVIDYYDAHIQDLKGELSEQLLKLGISPEILRYIKNAEGLTNKDINSSNV